MELVDFPDQATAYSRARIIRVQRNWRRAIFERGLSHVTRYYPLALTAVQEKQLPVSLVLRNLKIYRGPMLSRTYESGRFTGLLRLGNSYIAETADGCRYAADDLFSATQYALAESRSRIRRQRDRLKAISFSRQFFQHYLTEKASRSEYDPGFTCSLAPFAKLLPERSLKLLRLHGEQGAPLAALSRESIGAMDEIPFEILPTLVFELERAMHIAENCCRNSRPAFTAEDIASLRSIGDGRIF